MADEGTTDPRTQSPADEAVSDRGQRLVRRPPGRPPGKSKPKTIDDVVKKHVRRDVHTADDDVPPDEADPARRRNMTIGQISLTPDAFDPDAELPPDVANPEPAYEPPDLSDGTIRTLEDLNARFDFDGSGQFYIMVTRQKPSHRNGIATVGRMRNITTSLTHEEFCEYYGGGQYQLIVYGPPARGRLIDPVTSKPKPKALSKPITVFVPYEGEGAREPNQMAALEFSLHADIGMNDATDMQSALMRRRTNNLADAKMLETATQKELTMDSRRREDRREEERARREQEHSAIGVVREAAQETVELLREQLRETQADLKRLSQQQSNGKGGGAEVADAIARVATAFGPKPAGDEEISRLKDGYEERLKNLSDMHAERVRDLDERNKREMADRERVLTREKEDAIRRAEDQARHATEQLKQRETQLISDRDRERDDARRERDRLLAQHQRDMELSEKDHERDMARQKEHYESRLLTEQNTNTRDREALKESLTTRSELTKASVEAELRAATAENTRLRAENDRLVADLAKKSNLPRQIAEFHESAEKLGYARDQGGGGDSEPEGWQGILLKAGLSAVDKLPEILKNAGDLVSAARGGRAGAPAQGGRGGVPMQHRGGMPPGALPPGPPSPQAYPVTHVPPMWATEGDLPSAAPPPEEFHASALPAHQQQPMQSQAPPPPSMVPAPMPSAPPPTPGQVAIGQPTTRRRQQAQASAPPPAAAPPSQAPPPAEAAPGLLVSETDILNFAPVMEQWLSVGDKSPEAIAEEVMAGQPQIRLIAPSLTPEAIAEVLTKHGRGTSPLVRRDGQRFLARFRAHILGAS